MARPQKPMQETLRYKNYVANLKGRPPYVKEAALLKEIAKGTQWRMDAALEAVLAVPQDRMYVSTNNIMKHAAMFGRLQTTQNIAHAFDMTEDQKRYESGEAVAAFQVAALHGHYKVADFLAEKCGVHPDMSANDRTPQATAWAIKEGDLKKISYLVGKGANPSYMLVHAVGSNPNSKKIVDLLLRNGADVNYAQEGFWTPFLQALKYRRFDLADHLLDKGATPENDKSALEGLLCIVEAKEDGLPMLDKVLARGVRPDADMVIRALHADNLEAAEKMLEKGVNLRAHGGSALISAVLSPRADAAVDLCLKYGADARQALETAQRPKQSWERSPHQDKIVAALEGLVEKQAQAKEADIQARMRKPPQP